MSVDKDKIQKFVEENLNKAVTSAAAIQEAAPDEATVNGENKPSIQDAQSASEAGKEIEVEAKPAVEEEKAPEVEAAAPETLDEIKEQEVPEGLDTEQAKGGTQTELNIDHLFADNFTMGSVLKQNPNGGMNVANLKQPAMDYVNQATNSKNQVYTAEQLAAELSGKKD